jgi:membrane-associated phospholipid phosphatase
MKEGRFHAFMAAAALAVLAVSVYGVLTGGISVSASQLLPRGALLAALLAGVALYWRRKEERLLNLVAMCFWAVLFSNLHMVPMFLAGRQQVPPSDHLLARVDAALGVEVPDVMHAVASVPFLRPTLDFIYGTLIFLMALAIMIPPLAGRMEQAKEYALGCLVAALVSIPVLAVFQAVGPWSAYGFTPSPAQEGYTKVFLALKADGPFALDLSYASGLITFPSFHTILAVLAALALRRTRWLRWPAALLALLIVLSTITTGWHYVADVLAGLLVALLSFGTARAYLWLEVGAWSLPGRLAAGAAVRCASLRGATAPLPATASSCGPESPAG